MFSQSTFVSGTKLASMRFGFLLLSKTDFDVSNSANHFMDSRSATKIRSGRFAAARRSEIVHQSETRTRGSRVSCVSAKRQLHRREMKSAGIGASFPSGALRNVSITGG